MIGHISARCRNDLYLADDIRKWRVASASRNRGPLRGLLSLTGVRRLRRGDGGLAGDVFVSDHDLVLQLYAQDELSLYSN